MAGQDLCAFEGFHIAVGDLDALGVNAFVEFGAMVGQPLDPALTNLAAWRDRVAARPSAIASANPQLGIGEAA